MHQAKAVIHDLCAGMTFGMTGSCRKPIFKFRFSTPGLCPQKLFTYEFSDSQKRKSWIPGGVMV